MLETSLQHPFQSGTCEKLILICLLFPELNIRASYLKLVLPLVGSVPSHLFPRMDAKDDNISQGVKEPKPLPFGTEIQTQVHEHFPGDPTLQYTKAYNPTSYDIVLPPYHPPYENPIDGRYCFHFDSSAETKDYRRDDTDGGSKWTFPSTVCAEWERLTLEMAPLRHAYLELRTCIRSTARATARPGTPFKESPPFFSVTICSAEGLSLDDAYDAVKKLAEQFFPQKEYPDCYPDGRIVIRFFVMEESTLFALPNTQAADRLPSPSTQLRSAIEEDQAYEISTPATCSVRVGESFRELFVPNENLFGASLAVHGQRGRTLIGTLGCFVHLRYTYENHPISDTDGKPLVFGMTCAHVGQLDYGDYYAEESDPNPIRMASLGRRDYENARFSQKDRNEEMQRQIDEFEPWAEKYQPDKPQYTDMPAGSKNDVQDGYFVYEHLKLQKAIDAKQGYEALSERHIGSLFLASNRRGWNITKELDGFSRRRDASVRDVVQSDFAFVKMDPRFSYQSENRFSQKNMPLWYPAAADMVRSHRVIRSIGTLRPGAVVMKAGRTSNITFGKILPERANFYKKSPNDGIPPVSQECGAKVFQPGTVFASQGDSGAAVVDVRDGSLVGMVMGGTPNNDNNNRNCIFPIQTIQNQSRTEFNLEMYLHMGHHEDLPTLDRTFSAAVPTSATNVQPEDPWADGEHGIIHGWSYDANDEVVTSVQLGGTQERIEVPWSQLNKSWQSAVDTYQRQFQQAKEQPSQRGVQKLQPFAPVGISKVSRAQRVLPIFKASVKDVEG